LSFKKIIIIWILCVINQSGSSSYAGEVPANLKAYFQSFEKAEKKEVEDYWFSPDKGYHVMGSAISTTLIGQISMRGFNNSTEKSQIIGAGTTFTLGIAKEIYDSNRQRNYFSWKDLAANGVGVIIGILLIGMK